MWGHDGVDKPYKCDVDGCEYAGSSSKLLWAHKDNCHSCDVRCSFESCLQLKFASVTALRKHIKEVHEIISNTQAVVPSPHYLCAFDHCKKVHFN
jgi:hypothetical protein